MKIRPFYDCLICKIVFCILVRWWIRAHFLFLQYAVSFPQTLLGFIVPSSHVPYSVVIEGGLQSYPTVDERTPAGISLPAGVYKADSNLGRFLSLDWSKLRLCLANHRPGYFSNLACDWLSIVWAYSEQGTENGPWLAVEISSWGGMWYKSFCMLLLWLLVA